MASGIQRAGLIELQTSENYGTAGLRKRVTVGRMYRLSVQHSMRDGASEWRWGNQWRSFMLLENMRILWRTLVVSITTFKIKVNTRSYIFHLSSTVLSQTIIKNLFLALNPHV